MEDRYVYMTPEQIEERKAKIAAIEGLDELKAARSALVNYHQAKQEFERGEREYEDVPVYNPNEYADLRKRYPGAAVYLEADAWITTGTPIKVRLGSRAMEKILNGEDPDTVREFITQELEVFRMAQEG